MDRARARHSHTVRIILPGAVVLGVLFAAPFLTPTASADAPAAPADSGASVGSAAAIVATEMGPPEEPNGKDRRLRPRPTSELTACSARVGVCVHSSGGVPERSVEAALSQAESALDGLCVLGLPAPASDGGRGGTSGFDVYLSADSEPPMVWVDFVSPGMLDAASTFATMSAAGDGCGAAHRMAATLARAGLARFDAAANEGVLDMVAAHAASMVAPCATVELDAVDRFQRAPEEPLTHPADDATASGALLFSEYLDEAYGTGTPVRVLSALLSVATQRTPPPSLRWHNEPDLFDALRRNAHDLSTSVDQMLLDFAIQRAFVGSRDDGAHMNDVAWYGDAGRVRFEWSVGYDSLPRRLAPLRPISGTGTTYLWLDLDGAPPEAELTFVAEWEAPVLFRWALVKIDREGGERGRVEVAGVYGSQKAVQTVVDLRDLSGVLVVGVNLGDLNRAYPYDPDDEPYAPRSYTVTLYPKLAL
jgi:hypothetical protein